MSILHISARRGPLVHRATTGKLNYEYVTDCISHSHDAMCLRVLRDVLISQIEIEYIYAMPPRRSRATASEKALVSIELVSCRDPHCAMTFHFFSLTGVV